MKRTAVLDSSVVASGIGWRGGEARAVLRLLALRGFVSARTPWLTAEWCETVERVAREEKRWQNNFSRFVLKRQISQFPAKSIFAFSIAVGTLRRV